MAVALLNKGAALAQVQRLEDAAAAYGEAARRFEEKTSRPRSEFTEHALLQKAGLELRSRRYGAAIRTADRVLERPPTDSQGNRILSLLVRAKAMLASGDVSGCEKSINALLVILPQLDSVPGEPIDALVELGVELGPVRMLELIRASPAVDLLLPLSTAFEQELGLKPRVAREVERVARDIRRKVGELRDVSLTDRAGCVGRPPTPLPTFVPDTGARGGGGPAHDEAPTPATNPDVLGGVAGLPGVGPERADRPPTGPLALEAWPGRSRTSGRAASGGPPSTAAARPRRCSRGCRPSPPPIPRLRRAARGSG